MHFADAADLEQGITAEGQPEFPTPPRGCFQKSQDPAKSGQMGLPCAFLLAAPDELVYQTPFFTLHLNTCPPC